MSHRDNQRQRETAFANCCTSPGFWGVVLVVMGLLALLPGNLSRYVGPIAAIGAGIWLFYGPLERSQVRRPIPDYEPADTI